MGHLRVAVIASFLVLVWGVPALERANDQSRPPSNSQTVIGPRLSSLRSAVSQKSGTRTRFRSNAAAKAAVKDGEDSGKVIILDIAPGVLGIARTGVPPAPIPMGESVFGSLRVRQIYPPYDTPSDTASPSSSRSASFIQSEESQHSEMESHFHRTHRRGPGGHPVDDPRPLSGWPRIGQLHLDDESPAKGEWTLHNGVMHLGPVGSRLDILPESNPFGPLRARQIYPSYDLSSESPASTTASGPSFAETETSVGEEGGDIVAVVDLPPQHPSLIYAGLPPPPPSNLPNPFGDLEVFVEAEASVRGDEGSTAMVDLPPMRPSMIYSGLPPPLPNSAPNVFGPLEVFIEEEQTRPFASNKHVLPAKAHHVPPAHRHSRIHRSVSRPKNVRTVPRARFAAQQPGYSQVFTYPFPFAANPSGPTSGDRQAQQPYNYPENPLALHGAQGPLGQPSGSGRTDVDPPRTNGPTKFGTPPVSGFEPTIGTLGGPFSPQAAANQAAVNQAAQYGQGWGGPAGPGGQVQGGQEGQPGWGGQGQGAQGGQGWGGQGQGAQGGQGWGGQGQGGQAGQGGQGGQGWGAQGGQAGQGGQGQGGQGWGGQGGQGWGGQGQGGQQGWGGQGQGGQGQQGQGGQGNNGPPMSWQKNQPNNQPKAFGKMVDGMWIPPPGFPGHFSPTAALENPGSPGMPPANSDRRVDSLSEQVKELSETSENTANTNESPGPVIVFDFPPGYFGFGGYGDKFEDSNLYEHPRNPLNLNPFGGAAPKSGKLAPAEDGDWQPPPGVGENSFGKLRT